MNETTAPAASQSPTVFGSYGHAWRTLLTYFLELLLITAAYIALTLPTIGLWGDDAAEFLSKYVSFNLIFFEISGAPGAVLFSVAYMILLEWPLQFGLDFASLTAARSEPPKIGTLFAAFRNYWNAVLASLLVTAIVVIGFVMLIIPGIFFFVKLMFVPYLVVDRRMEAVAAVKESWRMTRGHGWKIFGILLLAIPVGLLGLLAFGIGIIVSIMWVNLALASLYRTVSQQESPAST